jgi:hypothetical protein
MRSLRLVVCAAVLGIAATASHAAIVTWLFEGEFTTFSTEYANAGLSIGDKLFGAVLFNSNAPDLHPEDTVRGTYEALVGFVTAPALGSHWTFAGSNNTQRITVLNDNPQDPPFDFFEIFFRNTSFDTVLPNPTRQFFIVGTADTGLFASEALPMTPPPVDAFLRIRICRCSCRTSRVSPSVTLTTRPFIVGTLEDDFGASPEWFQSHVVQPATTAVAMKLSTARISSPWRSCAA